MLLRDNPSEVKAPTPADMAPAIAAAPTEVIPFPLSSSSSRAPPGRALVAITTDSQLTQHHQTNENEGEIAKEQEKERARARAREREREQLLVVMARTQHGFGQHGCDAIAKACGGECNAGDC